MFTPLPTSYTRCEPAIRYHDVQYQQFLNHILTNGRKKSDRTGTGTTSAFGYQMRFDIQHNVIPVLSTKKMYIPALVVELEWYFSGDTSATSLAKKNVRIWSEWADQNGELGKIYGKQWRDWDTYAYQTIEVPPRLGSLSVDVPSKYVRVAMTQSPILSGDTFIGSVFNTSESGSFVVIDSADKSAGIKPEKQYVIQFIETGYTTISRVSLIRRGNIRDPYVRLVNGVGYLGDLTQVDQELSVKLKNTWTHMLDRCYNPSHHAYHLYGAAGIFVSPEWHCFANFVNSVVKLPNWHKKRLAWSNYELDKDYYSSNCYSTSTVVWSTLRHNTLYRKSKPFTVTTPDGDEFMAISLEDTVAQTNVSITKIRRALANKVTSTGGYKFKYCDTRYPVRYQSAIDQIAQVIESLRNNPDSRRIMVNAWNVGQLDQMQLPPCHYAFQFYTDVMTLEERIDWWRVEHGADIDSHTEATHEGLDFMMVPRRFISCMLTQRSADAFLGVPFNIAQYSMITCMLGKIVNMAPKEFIWSGGDCHIYDNHVDQVREQLSREPFPSPTLVVNPSLQNIDDFKFTDLTIVNYEFHPAIAAKVAV